MIFLIKHFTNTFLVINNLMSKIPFFFLFIMDIPFPLIVNQIIHNIIRMVLFDGLQILLIVIINYENRLLKIFNPFDIMIHNKQLYPYQSLN